MTVTPFPAAATAAAPAPAPQRIPALTLDATWRMTLPTESGGRVLLARVTLKAVLTDSDFEPGTYNLTCLLGRDIDSGQPLPLDGDIAEIICADLLRDNRTRWQSIWAAHKAKHLDSAGAGS